LKQHYQSYPSGLRFLPGSSRGHPARDPDGYFGLAERLFESAIELLRPVPPLAWVPLILAWFGIKALLIGFRSRAIL